MATIIANGCFDLLHDGHKRFLLAAKGLAYRGGFTHYPDPVPVNSNHLIVAINSDESARKLKADKWGARYPRWPQHVRAALLRNYADQILIFDTEAELHDIIEFAAPCIIVKGPDYAGRELEVTGSDIAPVIILDTPETEEIRELKRRTYA